VQVIQEVFCWTRLPMEVRRLAARKEDLFRGLLGDTKPAVPPGASSLLELLQKNKVRRICPLSRLSGSRIRKTWSSCKDS